MRIILDNNILFSLMKPGSVNSSIFSNFKFNCFAPEFIKEEFEKYEKECLKKSGLSKKKFSKRKKEIFSNINFISFSEFKDNLKDAEKVSPDIDDAPYFALALKLDIPLWSNDKALKNQDKVAIISTRELIEILY